MCLRVYIFVYMFVYLYCLLLNINVYVKWIAEEMSLARIASRLKLMLLRNNEIRVDHHAFNVKDIACDLYSRRMELRIIDGTTICIAPNEMLIFTYRRKTHYSVRFLGGSSRRMNNEKCGEPGVPEIE